MPRFVVQGWRRVVLFERSSIEIEAPDQQSANRANEGAVRRRRARLVGAGSRGTGLSLVG
jgi:hypothetical protein